jgi:dynein heavy chain
MPVIQFRPIKEKKKKATGLYKCPTYIYPIRAGTVENPSFQFRINLKSGEFEPDFWKKRGTALLMQLDT